VEAVEGGTSGILSVNGAGATINFISRKMNYDEAGGLARLTGATYGDQRADLFYSGPIANDLAYSFGGYFDSTKGVRSSPFTYNTYHFKGAIEKRFGDGGFVRLTYKRWDEHDPYYADMPYRYNNGEISGVPGLNTQTGNILGPGFASIPVPSSCADPACTVTNLRDFSATTGIHGTGNEYRIDVNVPINNAWDAFARVRYLQSDWDFNGIFPGSGSGNSGLETAVNYLTPGALSPISGFLTAGQAAFPTATQFGIKNLTTGQIIAGSNLAALNALNGNGLLQQTVLNQQFLSTRDLGSDFGVKWNFSGSGLNNSLTLGGMYYHVEQFNDQSGVATLINGVSNGSAIYDVVAMNNAGGVVGTLSNNGLISYGDWGNGIWSSTLNSLSLYLNDELALLDNKLHLDFGVRREDVNNVTQNGNSAAVNPAVPVGTGGIIQTVPNAFNGTYTRSQTTTIPTSWTVGANYEVTSNFSVYARAADGNQTNGGNNPNKPTRVDLYEFGLRYGGYGLVASATAFRTVFNNQNYSFIDPIDPAIQGSFQANSTTNGVNMSLDYRPTSDALSAFKLSFEGTYQRPKLSDAAISPSNINLNYVPVPQYDGNVPGRTPQTLYAVTPSYDLPNHLGEVYVRYKYIGKIYADAGNGLALPGYGVLTVGGNIQLTPALNLNVSVDNVTNELGLTEGNPRQGNTQSVVNGYFYGRGIVGPNAIVSLSYKF
jgi:iron complex outermembrane recepter protein